MNTLGTELRAFGRNAFSLLLVAAVAVSVLSFARAALCQDEADPGEAEVTEESADAAAQEDAVDEDAVDEDAGESESDVTDNDEGGAGDEVAGERAGVEAAFFDPETGELMLDRLLDWLDDLYRSDSSIATITLTVTKPRRTRTMTMKAWTLGEEKALIVIESPAREKGTATLKVGKNLWNYLPRIARTIRIPPSMMMSSWMGSDFTNDDLVRESSLLDDYEGELVGRSNDPDGWLVNLKAKEGTVGLWDRVEYVVSPDGRLPLEARYYDRRGRLARIMTFSDVREFDGRKIPARLELTPTDKEGHKTVLVYDELEFGADLPESMFSLSQLERHR